MLCSALYFIGAVPFDDIWASQCVAIKEWLDTGRRPLTVKRYGTNLGPWFTFLDKHELHDYVDLSPTGADDFRRIVIWFLYYCAMELKLSESKIQTTIQALQYALKSDGHSLGVFKDASVKLARDAVREDPRIKNAKRTRRKRLPVTFDMLFYLEDLLLGSSHIDDWMTFLGILMAFHFMLRISEYCLDGSSQHAIRCGDVLFLSSDGKVCLFTLGPQAEHVRAIVYNWCYYRPTKQQGGQDWDRASPVCLSDWPSRVLPVGAPALLVLCCNLFIPYTTVPLSRRKNF